MNNELAELIFSSYCKPEDRQELSKQLNLINTLKLEALDDLFKKKLKADDGEKSAGIGLLSMKMKSRNNFEFNFRDESKFSLLVLKISINLHHG